MADITDISRSAQPLLRIWLCGPFRIERFNPETGAVTSLLENIVGEKNATTSLALLKLLLCQPDRSQHRDWILEQFWPERGSKAAIHRLENVFSSLRTFLRLDNHLFVSSRRGMSGDITYQVEPYPTIWTDVDALAWNMEQAARMERFADDALPFWERAYALVMRGTFLSDERYVDWASKKRFEVEGHCRQVVHALAQLYQHRYGQSGEEQVLLILRTYWQQYPTDEDALRMLLELLGKQERYQEAEECFQHLCDILQNENNQPDVRTREIVEYCRTKQRQNKIVVEAPRISDSTANEVHTNPIGGPISPAAKPTVSSGKYGNLVHGQILLLDGSASAQERHHHPEILRSAEKLIYPNLLPTPIDALSVDWDQWFGIRQAQVISLVEHWREQHMDQDRLQAMIDEEILGFNQIQPELHQDAFLHSRRQFIISLAALPMAYLSLYRQNDASPAATEAFLTRCAASLTACWHLLKGNEIATVEQMLTFYLRALASLAQTTSHYQRTAAQLATQGYRLLGIVALHQNDLSVRETCCKQALKYSEITGEPALITSALISLASTFYYENDPVKSAETYRQALTYEKYMHPLQRSRAYVELAVVCAQLRQEQEALKYSQLAQEIFPLYPEKDPSYLYAEFSPASMVLEKGLTYLALANSFTSMEYATLAMDTFDGIESLDIDTVAPVRIHLEIINNQAASALVLKERDQLISFMTVGIHGANQLKSKQRRKEVISVYRKARTAWPDDKKIQGFADLLLEV